MNPCRILAIRLRWYLCAIAIAQFALAAVTFSGLPHVLAIVLSFFCIMAVIVAHWVAWDCASRDPLAKSLPDDSRTRMWFSALLFMINASGFVLVFAIQLVVEFVL